jgi:hypothetical protein
MDDFGVPMAEQAVAPPPQPTYNYNYGFTQRAPMSYEPTPAYAPPPPVRQIVYANVPPAPALPMTMIMLRDGNGRIATDYWFEGGMQLRYIGVNGRSVIIPMEALDLQRTVEVNGRRGVPFVVRSAAY